MTIRLSILTPPKMILKFPTANLYRLKQPFGNKENEWIWATKANGRWKWQRCRAIRTSIRLFP